MFLSTRIDSLLATWVLLFLVPLEGVTVKPVRCPTNKIAPHRRSAAYYPGPRTYGAFYDLLAPGDPGAYPQSGLVERPQEDDPDDCGDIEDYDETDLSSVSQPYRRENLDSRFFFGGLFRPSSPTTPPPRPTQPHNPIPPYWSAGYFGNNNYRPPLHEEPSAGVSSPAAPPSAPAEEIQCTSASTPARAYADAARKQKGKLSRSQPVLGDLRQPGLKKDRCDEEGFIKVERKKRPASRNQCGTALTGQNHLLRLSEHFVVYADEVAVHVKPVHDGNFENHSTYRPEIVGGPINHIVGHSQPRPTPRPQDATTQRFYTRYYPPRTEPTTRRPRPSRARGYNNDGILGSFVDLLLFKK